MTEPTRRALFSQRVAAGKSHYFFDVKENQQRQRYLIITESQRAEGGGYARQRITVYAEYLDAFLDGLKDAVKAMRK